MINKRPKKGRTTVYSHVTHHRVLRDQMEFSKAISDSFVASILPTRHLSIILDPDDLSILDTPYFTDIIGLIVWLGKCNPAIEIKLLIPQYLRSTPSENSTLQINPPLYKWEPSEEIHQFSLGTTLKGKKRKALLATGNKATHCRTLLSLANSYKVDGILTQSHLLKNSRYEIYQDHMIRIIPLEELDDVVEIFAHGHGHFRSAHLKEIMPIFDIFYQHAHWKGAKLTNWLSNLQPKLQNDSLKENLDAALRYRFSFVLYARDMVRFYELQMDHFSRNGRYERFIFPLGYHANNFYLHLWGMLDQLTIIAKYVKKLSLPENKCGITSDSFWDEMKHSEKALRAFVKQSPIGQWIQTMSDMRHRAAHNVIPMPMEVFQETEESKKNDEEIWEILLKENPDMCALAHANDSSELKKFMIDYWRQTKWKMVMKDVVKIEKKDGTTYLKNPILSIDYDLSYLNAVIDAFLCRLFSNS